MYPILSQNIQQFLTSSSIAKTRKTALDQLVDYIQQKVNAHRPVQINFICTHNSRRSHLAQIWAQVAASFYNIPAVYCYSGGTAVTALFPTIADTLEKQGFTILKISDDDNPVYAIKYDENSLPIIAFSKLYDHPFNPAAQFAAVMTCSQADGNCPFIAGAEQRIPITFIDPKISDHTDAQSAVYLQRSTDIAAEMFYVFSRINQ